MNKFQKTYDNTSINSLRESVRELTALQNNIAETHEILLSLLKGYCCTIEPANTSKKYSKEVNTSIAEIQEKINLSFETDALIKKSFSNLKSIINNMNITENESVLENYLTTKQHDFSKISKNCNTLNLFISKRNRYLLETVEGNINNGIDLEVMTCEEANTTTTSPFFNSQFIENTLLISETQNKVVLPYTFAEIKEYMQTNPDENLTIQNVIDHAYTIPLNNYKNSVVSRFSESFKLVRQKEKGSIKDALDLAFETAFNYNLHPAVITACDNINELDLYLACLEYNELDDFKFFNVNFEIAPTISKF